MHKIKFVIFLTLLINVYLLADTVIQLDNIATDSEDFTMWIALFGLGIISILALFLSSERVNSFKKEYKSKKDLEHKIQASQDAVLSKLGENIHTIAKDTLETHPSTTKSENQLLSITTSLIDFLRIKSKKVKIENNKIKLSHLFNDVSGTLKSSIKGKELELIYDIDNSISEELMSDTLNMSKILTNILLYCVENDSNFITLNVAKNSLFSQNDQLFFTINSHLKIDAESGINIFRSNYNETTEEYDSLGLFISRELSLLMQGDLIARNDENNNLEFVLNIPYIVESQEEIKTRAITNKNILVVDSLQESATQTKKILESLGHLVKVLNPYDYLENLHYFEMYEILFLDEKLFTNKALSQLEKTNIKIVSVSNIFKIADEFPNAKSADLKISKPLTMWQITDALSQIDSYNFNNIKKNNLQEINSGNVLVHRNSFQKTRNISLSSFVKFENKKILLVEDNVINQKVFIGVLGKSNMHISIAKHGKEALNILAKEKDFDIIFMDINMPVMDGYTASIKIRENSEFTNIPIIALSALTSNDEVAKMFASGMNGYLAKPLRKEKLFTVFSIYLENITQIQEQSKQNDSKEQFAFYGLNINLGISKSSSNEVFYKEILLEFKDAYGNIDRVFEKLVHDFRYEQLKILVIDIKGLTGTIGAEKLNTIVTNLLKNLSQKKYDDIAPLIIAYKEELKLLNNSIDEYLASNN